jgi:hypothetical protein
MKAEELRTRLKELGADIPLPTLRRWASNKEALIPKPLPYYKPLDRKVGRPKTDKESEAHPGRFSHWTEESVEAAAAVWAIRYLARPIDSSDNEMLSVKETPQKDISHNDIKRGQEMARSLHSLLYTDCKEAASRFRAYLWPGGFSPHDEERSKILNFDETRLYSLIPVCIHTVEKVRHRIALNIPIRIMYEWTIREDGSSAWKGMHIGRTYAYDNEISLNITHLKPCENGYSNDFGFPRVKGYMRDGFVDEFWLKAWQLGERFKESPFHRIPEEFYEDHKYAAYWDEDPYGWADYAAEHDFYED